MRRAAILLALAVVLGLTSCDQLFEMNLFKDITHEELSASDLSSSSPAEVADLLDSEVYRDQIAADPELKTAIIANLEQTMIDTPSGPVFQEAAVVLAQVYIETSPAAEMSTGLIAELPTLLDKGDTMTATDIVDSFSAALPADIADALDAGTSTPPQSFIDMIAAFTGAETAYLSLGADLDDSGTEVAYATDVSDSEALDIAVNAAVSVFVSIVDQVDTNQSVAEALWSALVDPDNADAYIHLDSAALTKYTDDSSTNLSYDPSLMNLLTAAGIDMSGDSAE